MKFMNVHGTSLGFSTGKKRERERELKRVQNYHGLEKNFPASILMRNASTRSC